MQVWQIITSLCVLGLLFYIVNGIRFARKAVRLQYRAAYRRGIVAGYAKCERKWVHRQRVAMHEAGRRTAPRSDAGPPATVSKVRYQSGR